MKRVITSSLVLSALALILGQAPVHADEYMSSKAGQKAGQAGQKAGQKAGQAGQKASQKAGQKD